MRIHLNTQQIHFSISAAAVGLCRMPDYTVNGPPIKTPTLRMTRSEPPQEKKHPLMKSLLHFSPQLQLTQISTNLRQPPHRPNTRSRKSNPVLSFASLNKIEIFSAVTSTTVQPILQLYHAIMRWGTSFRPNHSFRST